MATWLRIRITSIILLALVAIWPAFRSYGQNPATAPENIRSATPNPLAMVKFASISPKVMARMGDFLSADPSGWVDVMPHGSLQGWTRVAIPPDKPLDPASQWKLEATGAILCEGDHGHEWLRYDHELSNFLVHVEWRFEQRAGLNGYNSGVFVRNSLDGRVWHQAQVGALAFIFGQTLWHGELSPIFDEMWKSPPPAVNPLHPIGEWNTYEIRCDGPKITLWVNGITSGQFEAPEAPKGYFGLEAEGYRIEFRNIKLQSLP